jgi:hypothetical protein
MRQLELADIQEAATALDGKTLLTLERSKPFLFEVQDDGFNYTPDSTGKAALQTWKYVEGFLERFNELNSFQPSDYKDMSHVASYILVIIKSIAK